MARGRKRKSTIPTLGDGENVTDSENIEEYEEEGDDATDESEIVLEEKHMGGRTPDVEKTDGKNPEEHKALQQCLEQFRALIFDRGRLLSEKERGTVYRVKINKNTRLQLQLWNEAKGINEEKYVQYRADEPFDCAAFIVMQFVNMAVNEGPEGMRMNFFDRGGKPRVENPLQIEVLEIRQSAAAISSMNFVDPKRVPSLQ